MLNGVTLHAHPNITKLTIGRENTPLLIIDNFVNNHQALFEEAGDGSLFATDENNFYPGKRMLISNRYPDYILANYCSLLASYFGVKHIKNPIRIHSAFAIADLQPELLRPIQMLPHVDTTQNNQLAVIHYLCDKEHGGTSFYRHISSNLEVITSEKLPCYANQLKNEAMSNQLHLNPRYMNGSNAMFEQIYAVEAKVNRAIIYPSNILHSGNINPTTGLSSDPLKGRLTISSFIEIKLPHQE